MMRAPHVEVLASALAGALRELSQDSAAGARNGVARNGGAPEALSLIP
jgi:hypothetical protein